jgi:hypothetical protein
VGGFSVDFGGQCRYLPNEKNIQEENHIIWLDFHGQLDGKP